MNPIKKVCVFGLGGVGGYFGAKLSQNLAKTKDSNHEVYFIARGDHLSVIRSKGITLTNPDTTIQACPNLATDDMNRIPDPDLILLCVKSYALDSALMAIRPKTGPDTVIIPLLNGVDVYDRIRKKLKSGIVLPACVYVGTHIHAPGVIHQSGGDGRILFGKDPDKKNVSLKHIVDLFDKAGINYQFSDDPSPAIWEKFIFIAAYGLVTAYTCKTVGEVLTDEVSKDRIQSIMNEIHAIAKGKHIHLPETIIADSMAKGTKFPFDTKTSYQRDIELKGSKNEGDLFGGTIIRLGRELGIPTPVTEFMYGKIDKKEK